MKKPILTIAALSLAILSGVSTNALAANRASASLEDLAAASGLTTRDVQMLLGARTPHPQYLTSYDRKRAQFVRAVGEEHFAELVQLYQDNRITRESDAG